MNSAKTDGSTSSRETNRNGTPPGPDAEINIISDDSDTEQTTASSSVAQRKRTRSNELAKITTNTAQGPTSYSSALFTANSLHPDKRPRTSRVPKVTTSDMNQLLSLETRLREMDEQHLKDDAEMSKLIDRAINLNVWRLIIAVDLN